MIIYRVNFKEAFFLVLIGMGLGMLLLKWFLHVGIDGELMVDSTEERKRYFLCFFEGIGRISKKKFLILKVGDAEFEEDGGISDVETTDESYRIDSELL